jgi:hypothetical protein
MIIVGLVWLAAAVIWFFSRAELVFGFEFAVVAPRAWMARLLFQIVCLLYYCLLLGWVVPLAWGIYRAVKHR